MGSELYNKARSLTALEPHYSRHVSAMTSEGLHSKSDIAAELAWRDARIAELEAALQFAQTMIGFDHGEDSSQWKAIDAALRPAPDRKEGE